MDTGCILKCINTQPYGQAQCVAIYHKGINCNPQDYYYVQVHMNSYALNFEVLQNCPTFSSLNRISM